MKASKWREIVGKRALVVDEHPLPSPAEVQVHEVSPSGKFVKLQFLSGALHWTPVEEYDLIEVLAD